MIKNNIIFHGHNREMPWVPTLAVDPLSLHIGYEGTLPKGEDVTVDVANVSQEWSYISTQSWCTVTSASLMGDDVCGIVVQPQPAGAQPPRSATVTFSSDLCADKVVTVNQDARPG